MSEQDTRPPEGGGKKIAGLPRNAVIIGGVTLVLTVAFFLWRRKQAAATGSTAADGSSGTDYSGDISTLQSEYGTLADELAAMQGQGQGSSGSAGGGTPVIVGSGPTGTTGTTDTSGTTADGSSAQAASTAGTTVPKGKPKKKPGPRPSAGPDAHKKHMAHVAHLRHLAAQRNRRAA